MLLGDKAYARQTLPTVGLKCFHKVTGKVVPRLLLQALSQQCTRSLWDWGRNEAAAQTDSSDIRSPFTTEQLPVSLILIHVFAKSCRSDLGGTQS